MPAGTEAQMLTVSSRCHCFHGKNFCYYGYGSTIALEDFNPAVMTSAVRDTEECP